MTTEIKPKTQTIENTLKTLKALSENVGEAVEWAKDCVEGGEHHIQPIYTGLKAALEATNQRIFQIEDAQRDMAAKEVAEKRDKDAAAAVEKAKADRVKFESDAIAKAEAEAKVENDRKAEYDAHRSGDARKRYEKKDQDELQVLCDKKNVKRTGNEDKAALVNLLLQADGHKLREEDVKPAVAAAPVTAPLT